MSKKQSIKAVLLDMDGTLVNAFGPIVYALNRTLDEFGMERMSDVEIRRHTGRGECSMISLFGEHREAAAKRFLEFHDEHLFDLTPINGAEPLLAWLKKKGIPTGIVTSKSQIRADKQLAHLGWSDNIQVVIGLCEGRRQKPDPHTILLACESLDIQAAHAVMVGDGTADMKSAARAGAIPIGVSDDFSEGELREAGAQYCFQTLPSLHQWLSTQIA